MALVTACPNGDSESECDKLRREIDELMHRNKHDPAVENCGRGRHGLTHRFRELVSNLNRMGANPTVADLESAQNHIDEIRRAQGDLQKKLRQLDDKGCGDPPRGAWSLSERPVAEYQQQVDSVRQQMVSDGTVRAAGYALGGAGLLYGAYRVVRLIPSLFPALWPTLPANVALP